MSTVGIIAFLIFLIEWDWDKFDEFMSDIGGAFHSWL